MIPSILLASFLSLVLAAPAPAPQDIDFDLVDALPNPTYTIPMNAVNVTVSYNPSSILAAAITQITESVVTAITTDGTPSTTDTDLSSSATASGQSLKKRINDCAPVNVQSKNIAINSDDTLSGFINNNAYANIAKTAVKPSGWTQTFSNIPARAAGYGYLGASDLESYDVAYCAASCAKMSNCMSFNIFLARWATVWPAASCPNPSGVTRVRCLYWSGPIGIGNAIPDQLSYVNFTTGVTASNGYQRSAITTPPGYNTPIPLGSSAIYAPADIYGFETYLGVAMFNSGPFDVKLCADACSLKSAFNLAHPPTDGSPVLSCQFFNTYILYVNTTSNVQGQYCSMYTQSWGASYATNNGQFRGNDHYMIQNSFAVSNATNSGTPSAANAVYQAVKDIAWPGNSAAPYCQTLLASTVTASTTTGSTSYVTVLSTVTASVSTSNTNMQRRSVEELSEALPTSLFGYPRNIKNIVFNNGIFTKLPNPASFQKRDHGMKMVKRGIVPTPAVLLKYPNNLVTSACRVGNPTGVPAITITPSSKVVSTTTVIVTAYPAEVTSNYNLANYTPSYLMGGCQQFNTLVSNSTYQTSRQNTYTIGCAMDLVSVGDIDHMVAPNYASCFTLCDLRAGCSGFSYYSGSCYLKNLTAVYQTPGVQPGADIAWQPSKVGFNWAPTASPGTCQYLRATSQNSVVTDVNNVQYNIECDADISGSGDIGSKGAPSFSSCFSICDSNPKCNTFTFSGGICYLKNFANSTKVPNHQRPGDMGWIPSKAGFQSVATSSLSTPAQPFLLQVSNTLFQGSFIQVLNTTNSTTIYTLGQDRTQASTFLLNSKTSGLNVNITSAVYPVGTSYGTNVIGSGLVSSPTIVNGYEQIICATNNSTGFTCQSPTNLLNTFAICDWAGNAVVVFDNAQDATDSCGIGSVLTFSAISP